MRTPMLMVLLLAATAACGGSEFQSGTAVVDGSSDQSSWPEASAADDGPQDSSTRGDGDARTPAQDAGTDSISVDATSIDADDACALVQHTDGLGQTFYDCVPFGTYNEGVALDACRAWSGTCPNSAAGSGYPCVGTMLYTLYAGIYARWQYEGPATGHVCTTTDAGGCCPMLTDPNWE